MRQCIMINELPTDQRKIRNDVNENTIKWEISRGNENKWWNRKVVFR